MARKQAIKSQPQLVSVDGHAAALRAAVWLLVNSYRHDEKRDFKNKNKRSELKEEVLEFHRFSKQGEAETPRHWPRTSALTSELADSCCRNKQTRVSTHTNTNVISTIVHTSSSHALQHDAHLVHKLEWRAHCLSIYINCPSLWMRPQAGRGRPKKKTPLWARHEGLVPCSYAHGYMSSSLVPYIIINLLHKLRVVFVWMMVPNGATRCGRGVRARRAAYRTGTSPSSPCTSHPNPPGGDHGAGSSISSAQLSGWPVLLSGPRGRALLRAGSCATHAARAIFDWRLLFVVVVVVF